MSELLSVRDFSLSYGDRRLLSPLSFSVARGEYVAVLGQNGAGKSSLLNCLAMLEKRWEGEITLGGRSVRAYRRRELAQCLAYIPQSPGNFSSLSVRDWIAMGRYPYQSRL
ncbi:MAG: ABC transporter ATP-binding protein, partial [Thermoguttaceae bacterium]|nr:ABC transporter ATP-binding protein [Thermoguttaceae bacterium]